jgi:hypothetical protein
MSYDERCHELADYFVPEDAPRRRRLVEALAQELQDRIELFLAEVPEGPPDEERYRRGTP